MVLQRTLFNEIIYFQIHVGIMPDLVTDRYDILLATG